MADLVHELITEAATRTPDAEALVCREKRLSYAALAKSIEKIAGGFYTLGLGRHERLAVYLEKRLETVVALFGAAAAGGVLVPINALLKPEQVAYILADCNVRILVTSVERLKLLAAILPQCHDLKVIVVTGSVAELPRIHGLDIIAWDVVCSDAESGKQQHCIDSDMAAILYTSGSTGKSKGVVLSHRNLVVGAKSVSRYLENKPDDRILSVLPLSFDYGLSQLTTAFYSGATNVLMNYLLPHDIIRAVEKESITGLAAVPSLWIQLAQLNWSNVSSLRYITNSGGAMPGATLGLLRRALPDTRVFLMYGLTEAFRSTYLPPEAIDQRPDSMGKAIPNAEVLVLREDGTHCAPGEPGELVHRGSLVAMGYWNDHQRTAACFKPLPPRQSGLTMAEWAVWSGDTVRIDEEGYLYFIGRRDAMIKTSGYRVSPTEVEEVIYATGYVQEAVAIGVPHPILGQAIVVVAILREGLKLDADALLIECKRQLPTFMIPGFIDIREDNLPLNSNGKVDRKRLAHELQHTFMEAS